MDAKAIIDKISSTIVAAISGYVSIDQGITVPGFLGAFGTMSIALSIAYYIYKDSIATARLKHAQARNVEISNEELEYKMLLIQKKMR